MFGSHKLPWAMLSGVLMMRRMHLVRQATCTMSHGISERTIPQQHLESVAGARLEWHVACACGRQAQQARATASSADELYVQACAWPCALQCHKKSAFA